MITFCKLLLITDRVFTLKQNRHNIIKSFHEPQFHLILEKTAVLNQSAVAAKFITVKI